MGSALAPQLAFLITLLETARRPHARENSSRCMSADRNQTIKPLLLQMLEGHAVSSGAVDLWHIGTRMEQWVDKPTWDELQQVVWTL